MEDIDPKQYTQVPLSAEMKIDVAADCVNNERVLRWSSQVAELESLTKIFEEMDTKGAAFGHQVLETYQAYADLVERYDKLFKASKEFLADLEERVTRDGEFHPDEAVRDYLGHGKVLPIGNGVLCMLDICLEDKELTEEK